MTAREMQIEFERSIQQVYPGFTTDNKLDSDTIFYYINVAQERYINKMYLQYDQSQKTGNANAKLLDVCKSLMLTKELIVNELNNTYAYSKSFELPKLITDKFYLYLNSFCNITDHNGNTTRSNNVLMSSTDINKILVTNINKPILRNTCAVLNEGNENPSITIYHDTYTNVISCVLTYIRKPLDINVITNDDPSIVTECELDSNVHREIIDLAVNIFITEGAFRLSGLNNNNKNAKETNNNQ